MKLFQLFRRKKTEYCFGTRFYDSNNILWVGAQIGYDADEICHRLQCQNPGCRIIKISHPEKI